MTKEEKRIYVESLMTDTINLLYNMGLTDLVNFKRILNLTMTEVEQYGDCFLEFSDKYEKLKKVQKYLSRGNYEKVLNRDW